MEVTLRGHKFLVSDEHKSFWLDAERGQWEPYTFEILEKYVPVHSTYLDVGAWIGPTALFASRFCKRCAAFEPDPVAMAHLRKNLSTAGVKMNTYPTAVMDRDGKVLLGSEDLGNSMTRLDSVIPGRQIIEVPGVSLDSFFHLQNFGLTFIKMDVEGAEEIILKDLAFFEYYKPTLYLSLHPQWWRNPTTAMETINRVGSLYKHSIAVEANTLLFNDIEG